MLHYDVGDGPRTAYARLLMSSPYRDSSKARREQALALGQQISDLEAGFSEFFWSEVAPTLHLDPPVEVELPDDDASEVELDEVIVAHEGRLAALHRVERDYHLLEEAWRQPAPRVPQCRLKQRALFQTLFTDAFVKNPHLAKFEKLVNGFGSSQPIEDAGPYGRRSALTLEDVPFQILLDSYVEGRSKQWEADLSVQTTVSSLSGELQLTPQGVGSEILIAVRLRQDIKIGDLSFDGTFVIRGEEAAAEAMLTPAVRRDLLEVAKVDIPRVLVKRGLAHLTWTFEPNRRCLEAAMMALRGIRQAPPTKTLRH